MHAFLLHFMICSQIGWEWTSGKKNGLHSCSHVTYAEDCRMYTCIFFDILLQFVSCCIENLYSQSCVHVIQNCSRLQIGRKAKQCYFFLFPWTSTSGLFCDDSGNSDGHPFLHLNLFISYSLSLFLCLSLTEM